MSKSFLGRTDLARGIRNNNPGNLVKTNINWQGKVPHSLNTDSRFEQFYTLADGLRAMMIDVRNDIIKGQNTVRKLISEFAPAFENNTSAYINTVAQMVGIDINTAISVLDKNLLIGIAKAIAYVENGNDSKFISDNDYQNAFSILGREMPVNITAVKKKSTLMAAVAVFAIVGFTAWAINNNQKKKNKNGTVNKSN